MLKVIYLIYFKLFSWNAFRMEAFADNAWV